MGIKDKILFTLYFIFIFLPFASIFTIVQFMAFLMESWETLRYSKHQFWWFIHKNKCPECHGKLLEVGFPKDNQRSYKCRDRKCGWPEKGIKI